MRQLLSDKQFANAFINNDTEMQYYNFKPCDKLR